MNIKLPVPVLEIFSFYDIPERFFTERSGAEYFDKICANLTDFDSIDPADSFIMPHIHDKFHMMFNYFCRGIMWDPERFMGMEGQTKIRNGLFALLYSCWDYKFDDINVGIESGLKRFKEYQKDSILKELPEEERYVREWVKSRIESDKVCWILENLKTPWKDDFNDIDPLDLEILYLIRDTITYGPLYCVSYYPKELKEIQNNSLAFTLLTEYGADNIDKLNQCFNTYYQNSLRHDPYTEFTRNMVELYNNNRSDSGNVLNEDSINNMKIFLDSFGETEFKMVKARNPLPINEQMNIY